MEQFTTEIFLNDLSEETREQLENAIIDRLKSDIDTMAEIEASIIEQAEDDDEFITPKDFQWKTQDKLEERAKKILNDTFYGEITIGD